ncbi:MAG: tetratricopeptide repeat protein [Myxococcaceae bacterium]
MRIECPKCAAAYAIDDRLVTSKGVRAQCPRCRHLQTVKREEPLLPGAAAAPTPATLTRSATSVVTAPAAAPAAALPALEFEDPMPKPVPAARAPVPAPAAPPPRNDIDDLLDAAAPGPFAPAPPPPSAPAVVGCRTCGKPLTDSFDQALGLCDACRSQEAEAAAPAPAPAPAGPVAERTPSPPPRSYPMAGMRTAELESAPRGRSPGQLAAVGVIALVLVAVGVVLAVKRPWVKKTPVLAMPLYAGPIDDILRRWKLQYVELAGTSEEHLNAGEAKLALDTTSGYAEAEEEFQKALVLDPKSDLAVAGYLRALALGRGARVDDAVYKEALELIGAAEARSGGAPKVLIAHAELLLTRSAGANAQDARALAERAIANGNPAEQAQAHLAVGNSFLSSNVVWATAAFEKALAIDPKLRRGYYHRAQAFASAGEYRKAVDNLEQRLSLDPDQWEATDALARFYLELGETEKARKTYQRMLEASPRSARARLSLAMVAFQHQGKTQEAIDALRAMAMEREKFEEREVVEVLVQLVAAQRQAGQTAAALQDVNDALAIAASDPAAHLQALLLALDRNQVAQAKPHLSFLAGHLDDPGLEELLKGRVLFADGRFEEASAALQRAHTLDPRRTDALLLAGAAAAKAHQEVKAYELVLRRAVAADPGRSGPRPVMTRYYLSTADILQPAVGAFAQLSGGGEDPNPDLCEGLVRYFLKDYAEADRRLARVLTIDAANAPAYSYRSLIALGRNDKGAALRLAGNAREADRQYAVSHLVFGGAQAALGKDEAAAKAMREALSLDPKLLGPRVKLGELLRVREPGEAKKLLLVVVGMDGTYPGAKRALYQLDK